MSETITRAAVLKNECGNETEAKALRDRVARYLPSNYTCHTEFWDSWRVVISGQDYAGWTLDDYVIPRLASGLYWAEEMDLPE